MATAVSDLTVQLTDIDSLPQLSSAWEQLWQASGATLPTLRLPQLEHWLQAFAPLARYRTVALHDDQGLLGVLPLVERRLHGVMPIGGLPVNEWSVSGDLLLADENSEDTDQHLDTLVANLSHLPWQLLLLEGVCMTSPRWSKFVNALDRAGLRWAASEQFAVGEVLIEGSWQNYQASWSSNHRRHMKKALKKAESQGGVKLLCIDSSDPYVVDYWMLRGFEVESRSWKGNGQGTAVLHRPEIFDFYCAQARELAASGQLCLTFLMHKDEPIAFEYGWKSRGVYYTPKVGYDERFSELTPGQLLRYLLLEQFFSERSVTKVDYFGPLSTATDRWANSSYQVSRLLVGTNRTLGAAAVRAAKLWQMRPRRS